MIELTFAQVLAHNQALVTGLLALLVVGALAWQREPVCPDCPHCRQRARVKQEAAEKTRADFAHRMYGQCGDETCPTCRKDNT